ncbi:MAG TPA: sortase [Methylomirabilota bacterium]|nr:sortase [Methylomirabilota bacterium]
MPLRNRPARSFVALALVVNLVVAAVPGAALGHQPADKASAARPGPDAQSPSATASSAEHVSGLAINLRGPRAMDRPVTFAAAPVISVVTTAVPRVAWVTRATPVMPAPKPKSLSSFKAMPSAPSASSRSVGSNRSGASTASSPSRYRGRNHVWIPALGVNRSVSFFSCSSSAYPGNRVYRWGCAGRNNIYLFGHAHSVFKSLHDAYVRGRLSKGMKVIYADNSGRVSTYAVSWWKLTTPDKGAWAYAGQSRPSLTLQTCVGAKSQYRLIVRLLKVS